MAQQQITKVWTFESSSGSATYETLQYDDGSTSCNCMGWTRRVQPDGSRTCKHTRMVDQGVADRESISHRDYAGPSLAAPKVAAKAPSASKAKPAPLPVDNDPPPVKADGRARRIIW